MGGAKQCSMVRWTSRLLASAAIALAVPGLAEAREAAPATPAAPQEAARPNIVIFVGDDISQEDLGAYGSPDAHTPNLDRMAKDGMTFERAFASSPTCSVSRASLLTGDYPGHHGGFALGSVINSGIATLPQILEKQGYRVVIAGKTHFGPPKNFPFEYLRDSVMLPPGKKGVLWSQLNMDAVDHLLATRDRAKPLALIVASFAAHVRWPQNHGYDADKLTMPGNLLDTPDTRHVRTRYLTKVTLADTELGQLRASMAKYGMTDNTLLFFTADQGAQFPFAKWNLYDAGTRAPLLAVWPGHIAKDSHTNAMVSQIDLLPTMEAVAGGRALKNVDGRNMLPVLEGKTDDFRDAIFTEHTGDLGKHPDQNVAPMRAIRTDRYKLIVNFYPSIDFKDAINVNTRFSENAYWLTWEKLAATNPKAAMLVNKFEHRPPLELYDVRSDPYEMHNLAADPAYNKTLATLRDRLFAWMKSIGEDPAHVAMPDQAPHGKIPYTAKGD